MWTNRRTDKITIHSRKFNLHLKCYTKDTQKEFGFYQMARKPRKRYYLHGYLLRNIDPDAIFIITT